MSARFLMAVALGFFLAAPVAAQNVEPKKVKTGAEQILDTLHSQDVQLGEMVLNEIPVVELLQRLSKRHEVTFVIMEEQFKQRDIADIRERKSTLTTANAKGMTLHRFLAVWLASVDATYLVRGDYVEIIPFAALKQSPDATQPASPLVSLIVKEKPFNEAVEKLAEQYDLSVVIAPQSGDGRAGFVSARLKNVPPETALELLAVQCDLRVIRKGTAFLITSREHAEGLHNEKMERERQKIELDKFRRMPPPRPEAPPPPKGILQPGGLGELKLDLIQPNFQPGVPLKLKVDFPPQPKPVPKP